MSLKKKGTPEKLKVVKDAEVEKWEKTMKEIIALGPFDADGKMKTKKGKK